MPEHSRTATVAHAAAMDSGGTAMMTIKANTGTPSADQLSCAPSVT